MYRTSTGKSEVRLLDNENTLRDSIWKIFEPFALKCVACVSGGGAQCKKSSFPPCDTIIQKSKSGGASSTLSVII
jgi:hypothetical protein